MRPSSLPLHAIIMKCSHNFLILNRRFSNNEQLISFLNYIQFKYIPCDVLVKDVYPLKIVPHYTMIRALAHQVHQRCLAMAHHQNSLILSSGRSNIGRISKSGEPGSQPLTKPRKFSTVPSRFLSVNRHKIQSMVISSISQDNELKSTENTS